MRYIAALTLLFLTGCTSDPDVTTNADIAPEAASGFTEIKSASATRHMAVTANPHASRAANAMLRRGGTAVDAAIAAQMVLGLVEPQSSGIGGGAFALHWDATEGVLSSWDGRETAPATLTAGHFLEDGKPMGFFDAVVGGHAVGVPGAVAMLDILHQQHGRLPWKTLFQPAIELAKMGFALSPRLHTLLTHMPRVAVNPAITEYFFQEDGITPKPAGTVLRNPAYARSLSRLANYGAADFYRGELAREIVAAVQNDPNRPGQLSIADMAAYEPKQRKPVCGDFRAYLVCGMGPPSSGGSTVAAILGMLQHFDTRSLGPRTPQRAHLFAEASRLAFADRNRYIGDPDFVDVPTEGLVDTTYLRKRSQLIQHDSRLPEAKAGTPPGAEELVYTTARSPELPSTSHLSIVDRDGNIVSMTTSIETGFGSRIMVGGFLLNNQLTDFSFVPENAQGPIANRAAGGKRPRSSMSPTIVFEGDEPRLVIGSPGGARIIDYVAQSIWRVLDAGMDVAEAIAAPHVVDLGRGLELEQERFAPETVEALRALGHTVKEKHQTSGLHGIWIGAEHLQGGADPRREGSVSGDKAPSP